MIGDDHFHKSFAQRFLDQMIPFRKKTAGSLGIIADIAYLCSHFTIEEILQ
jgi:hypothetical protein